MVFVPYRGLIFLNSKKDFVGELQEVFPSPTGDLYFSIPFETPYTAKTRFPSPTGDLYFSIVPVLTSHAGLNPFPSPTGDLYFSIVHVKSEITDFPSFPSPTGDLYFSIPSPQFLVNTDCITQFAWEMIFQKYKFIFHYKKLSKCLFYAVRGKTNIF